MSLSPASTLPGSPATGPGALLLQIRNGDDVVHVRTAVRQAALAARFNLVDQTKLVTAASELARNTLDYGKGGTVSIHSIDTPRPGLRLTFEDCGPGIPDIALALTDGWTSGTGMGLGLSGSRRLMDEFDIASEPGKGTTVVVTKWKR